MFICFKFMYLDCRGIIDVFEIKVQVLLSLVLNSEMYLLYKSYIIYKGNVVILFLGEIIYISFLFEGLILDKELVRQFGFLLFFQFGDQFMVDKGFVIQDFLIFFGCEVVMFLFFFSKRQFFKNDF